jgi:hypothetical protein
MTLTLVHVHKKKLFVLNFSWMKYFFFREWGMFGCVDGYVGAKVTFTYVAIKHTSICVVSYSASIICYLEYFSWLIGNLLNERIEVNGNCERFIKLWVKQLISFIFRRFITITCHINKFNFDHINRQWSTTLII